MDPQLRHDLRNRFLSTTVDSYVTEILHVDSGTFQERKSKDWQSVKDQLHEEITSCTSASSEAEMYRPFCTIATRIVESAETVLQQDLNFPFNLQYRNQSEKAPKKVEGKLPKKSRDTNATKGTRLPDVVSVIAESIKGKEKENMTGETPENLEWDKLFLLAEFRKGRQDTSMASDQYTPESIASSRKNSTSKKSSVASSSKRVEVDDSRQSREGRAEYLTPVESKQSSTAQSQSKEMNSERSLGKRKASAVLGSQPKRVKSSDIPKSDNWETQSIWLNPEEQIANYAMELFSVTGLRSHALGMLITDTEVKLCFFDREGCIVTESFDFIKEFDRFATILVSLHLLNAYQWGFHPFLNIPTGVMPHVGTDDTATTMIIEEITVRLTGLRHKQYGLVGRGTVVFDAIVIEGPEDLMNEKVVVKSSWQVTTRLREDEIIRTARHRLLRNSEYAKYAENIPEIYASCQGTKLSTLRSKIVSKSGVDFEDRIIHIIIFPCYEHIGELETLELFMNAFKEIFYCHHALFMCLILHRDISKNNVMCHRRKDGRIVGILLDFDLALLIEEDGKVPNPTNKFRTGTIAFMAIDLLEGSPGPHLYRYDLESFVYVLVWISCYCQAGNLLCEKLPKWLSQSPSQQAQTKRTFITAKSMLPISEFYETLRLFWITELCSLLYMGYETKRKNEDVKDVMRGFKRNRQLRSLAIAAKGARNPSAEVETMQTLPEAVLQKHPQDEFTLYNIVTFENFSDVLENRDLPEWLLDLAETF